MKNKKDASRKNFSLSGLINGSTTALLVILGLAGTLRISGLAQREIWYDEALTIIQAEKGFMQILRDVPTPIHYWIVSFFLNFGKNTFSLGLPSVILGVLSVFMVYKIGKKYISPATGIISSLETYKKLNLKVKNHRKKLLAILKKITNKGKKVFGYGASTKGSVILQYSKINKKILPYIAEVNEYKFGRLAPGTDIPIISEKEARELKPDYFLVLPWHFEKNITLKESNFLKTGGKLIFPLPKIKIV